MSIPLASSTPHSAPKTSPMGKRSRMNRERDGYPTRHVRAEMSDTIISVENLSKRYLVGHRSEQYRAYTALRDVIAREARNFLRKAADFARGQQIVQGDE